MATRTKSFEPGRGYTKSDWDAVSDTPPLTDAELAAARPLSEVLPEIAEAIERTRKSPDKEEITLLLDRTALKTFRATGEGWQTRIDEALKLAARKLGRGSWASR